MYSSEKLILRDGDHPRFVARLMGLLFLLTGATAVFAFLILREESLAALGVLLMGTLLATILVRWERGVYGLLLYLPISGAVTLSLLPWNGAPALNPVLLKDWLFVLPAYLGFFAAVGLGVQRIPRIDILTGLLLSAFTLLVGVEMLHPGIPNTLTALIGAKVWLTYVPLYFIGSALAMERRNLTRLWRLMAMVAVLPCFVGLCEYAASLLLGYQQVMAAIYGSHAADVTQELTSFLVGEGAIMRIPSTFTFVTQYFGFTLAMIVPSFALWRSDPSPSWRRIGGILLLLVTLAGFLCGARSAFVFFPLALLLIYWLERGLFGALRAFGYVLAGLGATLGISRMAARPLFDLIWSLFSNYAVDTAYGGLAEALSSSWLGHGTGTNTGPARYAMARPELFVPIENFYAKAAYELGVAGLVILIFLFAALIFRGLKALSFLRDPGLHATASALTGFLVIIALNSFKGWLLDLDPVNVYFWLFAGLLAGLARQPVTPPVGQNDDFASAQFVEAQP